MALSYVLTSGNGATTNFAVPFPYIDRTHVHVYISGVETTAFTWVNGSTIQITPAPASGTLNIEIRRQTPRDVALVDYVNGSVLFDTDLDIGNQQSFFISQEYFEQAESLFPSGHALDSHTDALVTNSVAKGTMRVYDENSMWRDLPVGTNGQTLESDSAVARGVSWKQGLRTLFTTAGDILYATGSGVAARLGIGSATNILSVVAGVPAWVSVALHGFTTGDAKLTLKSVADTGWVMANDGTIGSATSGATTRANADTQDLYTLLWNNVSNTYAPVSTGRGANAASDFAANKTIALTKQLGRALGIAGAGAGLTSRALGETLGAENAVVVTHTHTHGITDPGHAHQERAGNNTALSVENSIELGNTRTIVDGMGSGNPVQPLNTTSVTTGLTLTINSTGSSGTGANMQPTAFWNVMIKL